jgi:O6-methylguanine-DNA--protein-cysteine methyltransferase
MAVAKHVALNNQQIDLESMPARVYWGCHDTPMGPIMLGISDDNTLCKIAFSSSYGALYDLSEWKEEWPDTEFIPASARTAPYACRIVQMNPKNISPATYALYGASFQLRVLKAMLSMPQDQAMSYAELTKLVQKPKAA